MRSLGCSTHEQVRSRVMPREEDIQGVLACILPALGSCAWGTALGHGSFLTIEFGAPVPEGAGRKLHGNFHLWVSYAAWRIEDNLAVWVASEDPREKAAEVVKRLDGRSLVSVTLAGPSSDATFEFEGGVRLRVFCDRTEEGEQWSFFFPPGQVVVVGPANLWAIEAA
jgi:hypothetical protein